MSFTLWISPHLKIWLFLSESVPFEATLPCLGPPLRDSIWEWTFPERLLACSYLRPPPHLHLLSLSCYHLLPEERCFSQGGPPSRKDGLNPGESFDSRYPQWTVAGAAAVDGEGFPGAVDGMVGPWPTTRNPRPNPEGGVPGALPPGTVIGLLTPSMFDVFQGSSPFCMPSFRVPSFSLSDAISLGATRSRKCSLTMVLHHSTFLFSSADRLTDHMFFDHS